MAGLFAEALVPGETIVGEIRYMKPCPHEPQIGNHRLSSHDAPVFVQPTEGQQ